MQVELGTASIWRNIEKFCSDEQNSNQTWINSYILHRTVNVTIKLTDAENVSSHSCSQCEWTMDDLWQLHNWNSASNRVQTTDFVCMKNS